MELSVLKQRRQSLKGFLLFELMVAVVVLSVSLAVISRSFISSLSALQSSAHFFKGGLLLEKKMWDLGQGPSLEPGKEEGTFEEFEGTYHWSVDVKEMGEIPLYETLVTVGWKTGRGEQSLRVTTYVPLPLENE